MFSNKVNVTVRNARFHRYAELPNVGDNLIKLQTAQRELISSAHGLSEFDSVQFFVILLFIWSIYQVYLYNIFTIHYLLLNIGFLFSLNAIMPSLASSVPQ